MKILFYTDTAVPHLGGKSSHIIDLSEGLKVLGNEVHIISSSSIPKFQRYFDKFKKLSILHYKYTDFGTYSYKSMEITDRTIQKLVKEYLNKNNVDIISAQDPISALYAYELSGNKIPIVLTMHSYFGKSMTELTNDKKGMRQKDFDRLRDRDIKSLGIVQHLIAVDTRIKNDCETYIKSDSSLFVPCTTIPNFVNTEKYKPSLKEEKRIARNELEIPDEMRVMICVRRLVDKNGVFYAIEAMKKINGVILLIGGDGPNMNKLKNYVYNNSLTQKIRFLGGIDGELKKKVYAAADYSIVPSITVNGLQEATSISAIEGMSCGLVTIVSSIGGLRELVQDHVNGLLVPEKNSAMISAAVNDLQRNETEANYLSKNARKTVEEKYSHIAAAKKYYEVFRRAAQ